MPGLTDSMLGLLSRFATALLQTALFFRTKDIGDPNVEYKPAIINTHLPFRYDEKLGRWVHSELESVPIRRTLRVATHNVLKVTGWITEWIIRSPERFNKEMQVLEEINADVIGLNEVTLPFLEILQEQDWVRKNYFLSDVIGEDGRLVNDTMGMSRTEMGNLILSRIPFKNLKTFTYSSKAALKRNTIIGYFFDNNTTICSSHLTAYEECGEIRRSQLKEQIDSMPEDKEMIIMGDLNLHLLSENALIPEVGFRDLWHPTEEDPNGYSWDTLLNPLIRKFLFLDRRRMRLDRIMIRGKSWKAVDGVKLFAREPVHKGSYLMCSDHFGLVTDLVFQK